MTSTVLDVTVLLLCVSASVVALGGVGDDGGARGPTVDEAADRLVTETVTVRYRTPEAVNGTRTVHATRAALLALLVADDRDSDDGRDSIRNRDDLDPNGFESRATEAIAAGLDDGTRIDATITATARRERDAPETTVDRRGPSHSGGRRAAGLRAAPGATNAPAASEGGGFERDGSGPRSNEGSRSASGDEETVAVGTEPPRNVDVTATVVTYPTPGEGGTDRRVRIVVRRW